MKNNEEKFHLANAYTLKGTLEKEAASIMRSAIFQTYIFYFPYTEKQFKCLDCLKFNSP